MAVLDDASNGVPVPTLVQAGDAMTPFGAVDLRLPEGGSLGGGVGGVGARFEVRFGDGGFGCGAGEDAVEHLDLDYKLYHTSNP